MLKSLICLGLLGSSAMAFLPHQQSPMALVKSSPSSSSSAVDTSLFALYTPGRSASRRNSGKGDRSKRQYRVGQFVQTELGRIIHAGNIKGDVDVLEDAVRKLISVVSVDVSPDLRHARVTVSVRKSNNPEERNPIIDKRRAYSWLVQNAKPIRHALAQKMSHMKSSPDLTFVQVDVGAAVDVMYLIDKVAQGYTREKIGEFDDSVPSGYVDGMDFDEEFDEDDWDDEDDDFFDTDDNNLSA